MVNVFNSYSPIGSIVSDSQYTLGQCPKSPAWYFSIIWAMPRLVRMYRAWISPYNISAACSIRSDWLGLSSSSSSVKFYWFGIHLITTIIHGDTLEPRSVSIRLLLEFPTSYSDIRQADFYKLLTCWGKNISIPTFFFVTDALIAYNDSQSRQKRG